jgi:hypothetical protein
LGTACVAGASFFGRSTLASRASVCSVSVSCEGASISR